MIKVSIIVPVYNAGPHLKTCIDSLLQQTLNEIEILLVIDCPTDGSEKVCEEYASIDSRIKLIYNSSNLHIGFSRNKGIDCANGEFVGFVDHDDFCEADMFHDLYNSAIDYDADIAMCNIVDEFQQVKNYYSFPTYANMQDLNKDILLSLIEANRTLKNTPSVNNGNAIWNKIYRKNFLTENAILFTDNRVASIEDVVFSIKAHFFARKIVFIPKAYYHHVSHDSNTFIGYDYLSIKKVIPHLFEIEQFLKTNGVYEKYKQLFANGVIKRLYTSCINEFKHKGALAFIKTIFQIRKDENIQVLIADISSIHINKLPFTKRFFTLLINV